MDWRQNADMKASMYKAMPQIFMTRQKYTGLDNGKIMKYCALFISPFKD